MKNYKLVAGFCFAVTGIALICVAVCFLLETRTLTQEQQVVCGIVFSVIALLTFVMGIVCLCKSKAKSRRHSRQSRPKQSAKADEPPYWCRECGSPGPFDEANQCRVCKGRVKWYKFMID